MLHKTISLREDRGDVKMTTYIIEDPMEQDRKSPLVVICPGGGYEFCSPREAEPIALQFNAAGIHAVVVDYSVKELYPRALMDLSKAVTVVRENAEAWRVDSDKIIVCGFSAGGHLAASLGVLWNKEPQIRREDQKNRPNGMILCYPVISAGQHSHGGSIQTITGGDPGLMETVSLEKQVDGDCPPAFIWHTFEDPCVPVENSLLMASALAEKKISTELHIYPKGNHGLSLANKYTCGTEADPQEVRNWIDMAVRWVQQL